MAQHHLLISSRLLPSLLKPLQLTSPSLHNHFKMYSESKEDDGPGGIGEKARSTAEEFSRFAKEKAESVSQTAKETWEGAKEAMVDESDTESARQKYKETVEKGNYDKMGQN